jgi:hypothetical protein
VGADTWRTTIMRYYMDCEFIEDGKTIDLVSIGIVAEDGRELYLQSVEFDPSKASEWVKENVFPNLSSCPDANICRDSRRSYAYVQDLHYHKHCGQCIDQNYGWRHHCPWRSREQIKQEILSFMDVEAYGRPEIWTYYGCYDHVALCQLFGTMMDLPDGYPMYTRDIMQWCEALGSPSLPEQSNMDHNALHDARWNKRVWDYLKMIEDGKGYLIGEEELEIIGNGDRELLMSTPVPVPLIISPPHSINFDLRAMVREVVAEELAKLPAQIRQQAGRVQ